MSPAPARLLVVDAEESVLLTIEAVLREEGYDVAAANNSKTALEAIHSTTFDAIVTALRIDDMDGLSLMAEAQKRDPETVTIIFTGYASLESAIQALRHGAFNYLLKPCNIDELKLTIARGIEKKRLAEALRERVSELEEAYRTIRSFSAQLEDKVREATTELGQRVQELQQSRGRLDTVIDSIKDGLIVYDQEGHVVLANPFVLSLLGLLPDDVVGQSAAAVADLTGEPCLHLPVMRTETVTVHEFETHGEPRHFIRRVVSAVRGDPQLGFVVVYQDMTEQKDLERLKDDFLSIASHELKTPLTSILGYTQLLLRRLSGENGDAGGEQILGIIETQSQRMKRLVDDLLDVSRIERGALKIPRSRVDLARVIHTVVKDIEPTSGIHTFQVCGLEHGAEVWGDEDRLQQVMTNLLNNAVKYSPDGGQISVIVDTGANRAAIEVRDPGIGIPSEQLPRVFGRFYQVENTARSRRFGGMGLGLFISKGIIEELGGEISVKSAVGQGSTFRFVLPLVSAEQASAPVQAGKMSDE